MRASRRISPLLACTVSLFFLAGCATGIEDEARIVDDERVPFDLLQPGTTTTPPATVVVPAGEVETIYLVKDNAVVARPRTFEGVSLNSVVLELAAALSSAEIAEGLRTMLEGDGKTPLVVDVQLNNGVATVEISPAFTELDGASQLLALAQLVLTLTAQPGVGQVVLTASGVPIPVLRANGTTTGDPVGRDDYTALLAIPSLPEPVG